ncbi:hypothetical protein AUP68_17815 [Ilyonectria robusta]
MGDINVGYVEYTTVVKLAGSIISGVATYFPPSHATLQPIREELSQLWGVNLPFDRIYYPRVDAKKESACFQGNIPTLEPTLLPTSTGNNPAPVRQFTPINAATTSSLQQPSVTQSARKRSLGFGPDLVEKRAKTLRMEEAYRRLDALEANNEGFQTRFAAIELRFAAIEMRFAATEMRFAATETTTTRTGVKLGEIGSVVDDAAKDLEENWNMHYKYGIDSLN